MRLPRLTRWRFAFVAVALLAAVAVGVAWVGEWGRPSVPPGQVAVSPTDEEITTGTTRFPPADRLPAPAVRGETLDGDRLALADLRGRVVVVNVWGSWCAPCQEEAPELARLATETRDAGVRFVGIDTRDNESAARAFVREFGIPYPSLNDPDGRIHLALKDVIPVSAVPSTVVIDRDGRVAARVIGQVTYQTLRGLVDDIKAERRDRSDNVERKGSG